MEIKRVAAQIIKWDSESRTERTNKLGRDFVQRGIYEGYEPEDKTDSKWQGTLDNLLWITYRIAKKYMDADEYNAYKHGVRMVSGESKMALGTRQGGISLENAIVIGMPFSITHFKFKKLQDGTGILSETKEFNPEESIIHVRIMTEIIGVIKQVRIASLKGADKVVPGPIAAIDRDKIAALSVCFKWGSSLQAIQSLQFPKSLLLARRGGGVLVHAVAADGDCAELFEQLCGAFVFAVEAAVAQHGADAGGHAPGRFAVLVG